eukprot:m.244782 g.244782  ORF g.244782 m.244782 type:complete len:333 (+) comp14515_c0_seq1:462-1460(+)
MLLAGHTHSRSPTASCSRHLSHRSRTFSPHTRLASMMPSEWPWVPFRRRLLRSLSKWSSSNPSWNAPRLRPRPSKPLPLPPPTVCLHSPRPRRAVNSTPHQRSLSTQLPRRWLRSSLSPRLPSSSLRPPSCPSLPHPPRRHSARHSWPHTSSLSEQMLIFLRGSSKPTLATSPRSRSPAAASWAACVPSTPRSWRSASTCTAAQAASARSARRSGRGATTSLQRQCAPPRPTSARQRLSMRPCSRHGTATRAPTRAPGKICSRAVLSHLSCIIRLFGLLCQSSVPGLEFPSQAAMLMGIHSVLQSHRKHEGALIHGSARRRRRALGSRACYP